MISFLKIQLAKILAVPLVAVLSLAGYHISNAPVQASPSYAYQAPAPAAQPLHIGKTLGAFNPTAAGTYYLEGGINSSATTFYLSSFTEPISLIPYTMSYLNSSIEYGVIDPNTPNRSELVSFTGITQNSDGSATLTGVTRGLSRSYPYTASTTLAVTHAAQAQFILSDTPQLFSQYTAAQNNAVITGSWSFPTPTAPSNPATMQYVLNTISSPATVSFNKIVVAGQASGSVTIGQIVYFATTTNGWATANASLPYTFTNAIMGIAQSSATNGNPIANGILLKGLDTSQGSSLSGGTQYYLSASSAGATTTSVTAAAVGIAENSTSFYFDPNALNSPTMGGYNIFTNTATSSISIPATSTLFIAGNSVFNIGKNMFATSSPTSVNTQSMTFNVPVGITRFYVCVLGGGGGSGGTGGSGTNSTGGGGAGGYACGPVNVTGTSTVELLVGGGGTAGVGGGSPTAGGTGGTTQFGENAFISAPGGGGTLAVTNGVSGGGSGGVPTNVGTGFINIAGSNGTTGINVSTTGLVVPGGSTIFGSSPGAVPGIGAQGSTGTSGAGSVGMGGAIIIQW